MFYEYHFFGMHMLWWIFWVILMFALFGWFEPVPKKRVRRDDPFEILRRRFAAGEIDEDEYNAKKAVLDRDAGNPQPQN